MVSSVIEICNMALAHLRQRSIASLAENSPSSYNCTLFYAQSVNDTLRAADWGFARTYAYAVPLVGAPAIPGWAYAYAYPEDAAAVRGIARGRRADPRARYTLTNTPSGRAIYTNHGGPVLIYTSRSVPIERWDTEFVTSLTYHLAMKLAIPLTGKSELMQGMQQLARQTAALAVSDNANEEEDDFDGPQPEWLAIRGIPNMTRREMAASGWGSSGYPPAGLYALPGQLQANPVPPMITAPGETIRPAYIPGLTAPLEDPGPILGDNIEVHALGGRVEADGSIVYDDPNEPDVNNDPDFIEG